MVNAMTGAITATLTTDPSPPGITDEDLHRQASFVRGLLVQRLEQIWTTVAPHVDGTVAEEGLKPDPRFIEAGIRVLDRLAKLYRLDSPIRADEDTARIRVDPAVLVGNQLAELEAALAAREQ